MGPFGEAYAGKTILVTGASSGIGRAIALALAPSRCKIALFARRHDELEVTARDAREKGAEALPLAGDVTSLDSILQADSKIRRLWGPVEVAFLCAGMGLGNPVAGFRSDAVRQVFDVNLFGITGWLESLLPPMMEARSGVIAAISSLARHVGLPGSGSYSASKGALSLLLDSLRAELRGSGVRVTTIEPGFVRTPMIEGKRIPERFIVRPEDAARRILRGVARGRPVIRFPLLHSIAARLVGSLPPRLHDRLGRGLTSYRDRK